MEGAIYLVVGKIIDSLKAQSRKASTYMEDIV